jgi:hypothetical protein
MVQQMAEWGWSASQAAAAHGVTPATAHVAWRLPGCQCGWPGRRIVAAGALAAGHRAGQGAVEHERPGDLLHIDTKKLGRIVRPGHRVTGNCRDSIEGAGWEMLFMAVDDHGRIAFTAMLPDEKTAQAVHFRVLEFTQ